MKHLIAISIGPVQEFIAASRRISDLTAGSELLVELGAATARSVQQQGGELIFPASLDLRGTNKILALLPEGSDPQTMASIARNEACSGLLQQWQDGMADLSGYGILKQLASDQINSFLEFYAAWMPYGDSNYADCRRKVESLLSARKNLRDFSAAPRGLNRSVYAKSPLDPAFECVLEPMPAIENGEKSEAGCLRLRHGEFLDAVSVLKRVKGWHQKQVPSTRDLARRHSESGFFMGDWTTEENSPEEYGYFAVLQADGDNMGQLIDTVITQEDHRAFSERLANFSERAKTVVKEHDGYPVYAGGDDVLALVPVQHALSCARLLATEFNAATGGSLSAGVAIVHYRQPLSLSRAAARDAEDTAKKADGKNSLCLAIHTRGSQPLRITQVWGKWAEFDSWVHAFESGALVRGVAYELQNLAREFRETSVSPDLLNAEVERIWKRKKMTVEMPVVFEDPNALYLFSNLLVAARFLANAKNNHA